jgi:hypothetical protein
MALNSTSVIKIIDLLCEGPIQGLVGASNGVFAEETPISNFLNADVNYDFRVGGATQSLLSQGSSGTTTVTEVGVEVGENYSETLNANNQVLARNYGPGQTVRQVTDTKSEFVELLLSIPALFSTAKEGLASGQLFWGKIRFAVDIQAQGGSFVRKYDKTITGVSTSDYQFKTPRLSLDGTGPWNIRLVKIDLGEEHFEVKFTNFQEVALDIPLANSRANRLFWTSLIEGVSAQNTYPFSALAGLSLSTRQFNSVPTRAYKIRGKIVSIPHNAVVNSDGSLTFVGTFNGSLRQAWTTCPVCCWHDMLTDTRYGAGDFVEASNISWVDLYPLAQYANQTVTNPDGSTEPRFACNTIIGNQAEAFSVLQDLASVFRGMLFWRANTIQATADHGNLDGSDITAVHLYTNSNVIGGAFNYEGTSLKTRSTSIRVRYNDPENFYKSNFVVVEDSDLIAKYGKQIKEIIAFGATSKFQAQRMGRWLLASEELDGEIVSFSTGLQGAVVLPGQVFAVSDEMRQGVRLAGRVSSATTSAITADQTIALPAGSSPTLTCTLADGTVEARSITSVSGAVINVSAFSSAPLAQSLWAISTTSVENQKFRCLSVIDNGDGTYSVTGVQHNDSIYDTADTGTDLLFEDVTTFNDTPEPPRNLVLTASEVKSGQSVINRMTATWSRALNGATFAFEIRYKIGEGNYNNFETTNTSFEIDGQPASASITFQIRAVGAAPVSKKSKWISNTVVVPDPGIDPDDPNKVVAPPDPDEVTIQPTGTNQVLLKWRIPTTSLDRSKFIAIIRHTPITDGSGTWPNSVEMARIQATNSQAVLPMLEGEYLIKFEDEAGQRSTNAKSAVIDLPDQLPRLTVVATREDTVTPKFQGQKDQVLFSSEYDGLVLDGKEDLDSKADFDAIPDFDFFGIRHLSGEYYFNSILDLGGKFSVVFDRRLKSRGIYPADTFDDRHENIDRWSDFDGLIPDETSTQLYLRTSDLATTDVELLLEDGDFFLTEDDDKFQLESDIDFGEWIPMESGSYAGRQFQFKAELTSGHIDQTPVVDELGFTMQLERRTEGSATISSGAGAKAVTFDNAFYQTPSIGITAYNLASGDYYEVTSEARTGFTITFRNSSNAAIDRQFQYQASGFGTQQT